MNPQPGSRLLAGLIVAAAVSCTSQHPGKVAGGVVLPFVENDFAVASSRAKEANLPLFVEVWAPW